MKKSLLKMFAKRQIIFLLLSLSSASMTVESHRYDLKFNFNDETTSLFFNKLTLWNLVQSYSCLKVTILPSETTTLNIISNYELQNLGTELFGKYLKFINSSIIIENKYCTTWNFINIPINILLNYSDISIFLAEQFAWDKAKCLDQYGRDRCDKLLVKFLNKKHQGRWTMISNPRH